MYNKSKVNQSTLAVTPGSVLPGELLNADWLNYIQTQYDEFIADKGYVMDSWQLCFFKKTITGNSNTLKVDGMIIGNPVIYIGSKKYTSYERGVGDSGSEDFSYNRFGNEIFAEHVTVAGKTCVVYYYGMLPHASTHSTGGSDALSVTDIGGYTAAQIAALIPQLATEAQIISISSTVKSSSASALCIRSLPEGSGLQNEIYDIGLV